MAGIIYLHPITDVRMRGSALRNLTLLKNVCGEAAYNHLALITTKWECFGDGDRDIALQREIELEDNWWGEIRNRGSITVRHRGTADSARDGVGRVLVQYSNHGQFSLRIHEEMIVQGLKLEDTSAGKELTKDVRQAQAQCQRLLDEAEERARKALFERRDEHAEGLSRQRVELNAKMLEAERNQEELRAHHENILDTERAKHESALRDLQQERDNADRRQLEMEKELETISKALEEGRQQCKSQRPEYEVRIEVLERQNRDFEAKLERSRIAQQEAAYRA